MPADGSHIHQGPGDERCRILAIPGRPPQQTDRAFKARYGLPPLRYRSRILAGQACALLRGTGLPLAEVARRCGSRDPGYFNRWFARGTGQPPGRWREGAQGGSRPS